MKRIVLIISIGLAAMALGNTTLLAHCQIPCGIYDDHLRLTLMEEHIATIEKSMNEIVKLSADKTANYNQLVRWIGNKDKHADNLSELVTYYFMAQRIMPADQNDAKNHEKYIREITLLHQMLYHAMKTKQTTDLEEIKKLRELLKQFQASYLNKQAEK